MLTQIQILLSHFIPAKELVHVVEVLTSFPVSVVGCRHRVAVSERLTYADGPSCPEHDRGAVRDLVHGGVAAVVHQAAGQVHARAQHQSWQADAVVVGLIGINDLVVEENHQVELQEDGSYWQPLGARNFVLSTERKGRLQIIAQNDFISNFVCCG